jgi:hypothetical protein
MTLFTSAMEYRAQTQRTSYENFLRSDRDPCKQPNEHTHCAWNYHCAVVKPLMLTRTGFIFCRQVVVPRCDVANSERSAYV